MSSISLCMIVKNEEGFLAGCLDSVRDLVEEIIIVDTGSTDGTKEIAARYTDKIYDFEWADDFSQARNFSFSQATQAYQFWLDADDVLLEADRENFRALKERLGDGQPDMVTFKYHYSFYENGDPLMVFHRERLLKRERHFQWQEVVHEHIELTGNIWRTDICVTHKREHIHPDRNLKMYEKVIRKGEKLSPYALFHFAKDLLDSKNYDRAAIYYEEFLTAAPTAWEGRIAASCYSLDYCYKMLGLDTRRLTVLLKTFEYGPPRAEICCSLGDFYLERGDLQRAEGWYLTALGLPEPSACLSRDHWGYIPNLRLCRCHYERGDAEKAAYYNSQAGKYKPGSSDVLHNEKLFQQLAE